MRAYEFITEAVLLEYKRDITAQRLGDALYKTFMDEPLRRKIAIIDNKDLIDMTHQMPLEQRKAGVVDELLQRLERADPSPNKQYVQWLARTYCNPQSTRYFEDVVSTTAQWLRKFYELSRRNRLSSGDRDINRFSTFDIFVNRIAGYPDVEMEKKPLNKGRNEEIYSDGNVRVIHPLDQDAACYYGQGTQWCTAATESDNYFDSYNKSGPLYILLPKKPQHTGEKYQLHFADAQYKDEKDEPVNVAWLLQERFPGLVDVFMGIKPDLINDIQFAPDDIIEGVWRAVGERYRTLIQREFRDFAEEDTDYINMIRQVADDTGMSVDDVRKIPKYSYAKHNQNYGKVMSEWNNGIQYRAGDIRRLGEDYSSDISGEDTAVTEIPTLWFGLLNAADSYTYLDDIERRVTVLWNKHPNFDYLTKEHRRFYKDSEVGDYVVGEFGGFRG